MLDNIRILADGERDTLKKSYAALQDMPADYCAEPEPGRQPPLYQSSLARPFSVSGPATYSKGQRSTLHFKPSAKEGWWLCRSDLPEQFPIQVSPRNVWTARRSIVLRSGCPDNYVRMCEHIIAQRLGMGLDNVEISLGTGDPPLFDLGSTPIVEAIQKAGLIEDKNRPLQYWTVKEPVAILNQWDGFLLFEPAQNADRNLYLDVGIDFPSAIGKQRIQFCLNPEVFKHGAQARTNCSFAIMLYTKTLGKLFADTRNLGYNWKNILVAGKKRYLNKPTLLHQGKSLEAAWHRACLDLLAALSMLESGRLAGRISSYKAGHLLDARLMSQLYLQDLLVETR
ncbi:MAG: UDP-3-O-acyl-N-acetylglucosamine deacetylase [Lentisphaeria bacterium]|jgi:UDP-3-O-acyl-N-acetylglucosamine deacetylase|nr:UDP-3-O-acyl-N-acetylglucosamine deacetylase [Lentisphaeria bacterium]MDY0175445.1 UDP-3-O-acyl-N-acetylglucosamine deacetylase [Lentisphaeria bacterium]NLZ59156.1 UDP-3-O-acyl-N-acetylglucosamine deacetylase [Lentisphaerota bacterium]